jgi:hypothetical protein
MVAIVTIVIMAAMVSNITTDLLVTKLTVASSATTLTKTSFSVHKLLQLGKRADIRYPVMLATHL